MMMTITDLKTNLKEELILTRAAIADIKAEKDAAAFGDMTNLYHGQQMFTEGRAQKLEQVIKDMENIDE